MKKKDNTKKMRPVLLAVGIGVAFSLSSIPIANAAAKNFGTDKLTSGYTLAAKHSSSNKMDAKCGNKKNIDRKCGSNKNKDCKCGNKKKKNSKDKDGKCGNAKCGS